MKDKIAEVIRNTADLYIRKVNGKYEMNVNILAQAILDLIAKELPTPNVPIDNDFNRGYLACFEWTCVKLGLEEHLKDIKQALIDSRLSEEEVSGALARGYCHKGCERYVMNPTLVMAMTKEVLALLDIKHKLEVEK